MAAMCAVCFAGPIVGALAALGLLSAIGAIWTPTLAVLAVIAGAGALILQRRRGTAGGCHAPHPDAVDLEMTRSASPELIDRSR
ncbi:MAG: hypothetical protein ACT4QF_04925 [Sporichthyaceae bacterium]